MVGFEIDRKRMTVKVANSKASGQSTQFTFPTSAKNKRRGFSVKSDLESEVNRIEESEFHEEYEEEGFEES